MTESESSPRQHEPSDVLGYVDDTHRHYALQTIARTSSVVYFLPLLHELFNGAEAKTKVLFALLHELMTDERVRWTRAELDDKFHWLRDRQRQYLLHRLSNVGWLDFYRDGGTYMISDKGEALMRILSRFSMGAELVENEGAALAEIEVSLLLESRDLADRLKFLRNRLMKHIIRAETALESESPYLILEIYQQLKSAYRWAEQTRETLDHIEADDDDVETWNGIRDIHEHLSKLHALISRMQLALQDIQRKQIDIARYGLTHLDFDNYLIHERTDLLSDLMAKHLQKIPHAFFTIEHNVFTEAQEILQRERDFSGPMRGWETDVSEAETQGEAEPAAEAAAFSKALKRVKKSWRNVASFVEDEPWETAAYRYSLLTLLADRDVLPPESYDPFMHLPVEAEFDPDSEEVRVDRGDEQWSMTEGRVRRMQIKKKADVDDSKN